MLGAALALLALGFDGVPSRVDGGVLLGALVLFVAWTARRARREGRDAEGDPMPRSGVLVAAVSWVVGVGLLVVGARALVAGSVSLATDFGMSERVIGLTMVAVGTRLPELPTSLVASWRGQDDIAVGNVVGSNIFNVLGILGLSSLLAPLPVAAEMVAWDIPWMLALSFALPLLLWPDRRLARYEAAGLLGAAAAHSASLYNDV